MTTKTKTDPRFKREILREAFERVICRIDEKNETVEEAAEAVYADYFGGLRFRAVLIALVRGEVRADEVSR